MTQMTENKIYSNFIFKVQFNIITYKLYFSAY